VDEMSRGGASKLPLLFGEACQMKHEAISGDRDFRAAFEAGAQAPAIFC
jgi:hypothetical protein